MTEAATDHPVLACARRSIHGVNGVYELDAAGAEALEASILAHAHDAGLPDALRTLFGLVVMLHDDLGSIDAARMLLVVLGRVQPKLGHLAPKLAEMSQALGDRAATLLGTHSSNAQKLRGAPPPGAISVQSLNIPQLTPPSPSRMNNQRRARAGGQKS